MEPTDLALVLGVAALALATLVCGPGLVLRRRARRAGETPPPFVGPLFRVELRRLSRQGTQLRLRTAYSLFLLVGLFVAYLREFPDVSPLDLLAGTRLPRDRVADLGETFFFIFVLLQLVGLTLVTPVFAGAAVFEERDGGTLELLRSSLLSDREIVAGKLAARVAFVLALTLTGLPILAVSMVFGGIDGGRLACAFAVAVFHTIGLAAYTVRSAVANESPKAVYLDAYRWCFQLLPVGLFGMNCFPPLAGVSPFTWVAVVFRESRSGWSVAGPTLVAVVVHAAAAAFFGLRAVGRLGDLRQPRAVRTAVSPDLGRLFPIPPVGDADPLLWKEAHFSLQARWHPNFTAGCLTALVVVAVPLVIVGLLNHLIWRQNVGEPLSVLFRGLAVILVGLAVPFVGLVLVGSVSRERQTRTLDSLFVLPGERADLLRAKWRSAYDFLTPVRLTATVTVVAAALSLAVHPYAAAVVAVAVAAAVAFFLALGLWLSVRCRTAVRASVWYVGLALAVFGLPLLACVPVARAAAPFGWPRGTVELFVASLSPVFAVGSIPVSLDRSSQFDEWRPCCVAAVAAALALGWAAFGLWHDAVRAFDREGRD